MMTDKVKEMPKAPRTINLPEPNMYELCGRKEAAIQVLMNEVNRLMDENEMLKASLDYAQEKNSTSGNPTKK
jgi:hypothetical protein